MATGRNPRDSADNQSEINGVTKEIIDVEAQVRQVEAAVEQAANARNAVRVTRREIAKKMQQSHLSEQERAALVAEQQLCDLTAAEKDLERLSRKEEQLRRKEEQLRKDKEQLREEKLQLQLREEKLQLQLDGVAAGVGTSSAAADGTDEDDAKTITVVLAPMLHSKSLVQFDRNIQGQHDFKELLKEVGSVGLVPIGKKVPEDGDEGDGDEEDSDEDTTHLKLNAKKLLCIPTLVTKSKELEDGAIYTVAASNKDVIRQMRQAIGHMLQAGEDQLGEATLAYAQEAKPGTVCSLAPGQRVFMEPDGRPSMEVDAVVIADDTAYFASHKLHLTGPKPVEDIVKAVEKVKRLSRDTQYKHTGYAQFGRFNEMVAVLGAEKVEPKAEVLIRDACDKNNVIFFKRNGRSFSVSTMNMQRGHLGHARVFGRL